MSELNDSNFVSLMLTAASPLIKSLVETFITPKLVTIREKQKEIGIILPSEANFTEYFHRTYKKLAVVNTLVFNNSQRFLSDIFIPLSLRKIHKSDNKVNEKFKISGFPQKISDEFGNILVTDTAGMGKSTLMKMIFIDIINKKIAIPIFIELRRLSREKKLIEEIQEQLNSIDKKFDNKILIDLLGQDGFIFILDGFDEIPLIDRDAVTTDIQDFISKTSNNRFFMTSRPEKALTSFGHFQEFKIDPLSNKEAFELLRKYDNQGSVSSLLIKRLQEKELQNIEEFLVNPLLVSLLFTAFEHKQAIPFKKYLFYRQVYDANFETHDLTKGESFTHDKYSNLEIDDFHKVLRHIGFQCLKNQKIEFTKDELLKLINESKEFCVGIDFNNSDFLLDLLNTVPLFAQDGNYYRWCHKSLQEYFAAQFIYLDSKGKQNEILLKLYRHINLENFINVLDLFYDMDYKTFRNLIEYELLQEYDLFQKALFSWVSSEYTFADIVIRKELLFWNDFYILKLKERNRHPFKDAKFKKILNDLRKEQDQKNSGKIGIYVSVPGYSDYCCLFFCNTKFAILSLLLNKKNKIVKSVNFKDTRKSIHLDLKLNNDYELVKVDDREANQLNLANDFSEVNKLLQSIYFPTVSIDHFNALNQLKHIKTNICRENEDDFLLSGI